MGAGGYAGYVGKGSSFDYDAARGAFLADVPEMDWKRSGLYWCFNLLVAQLLDREHRGVQRQLEYPPTQEVVEAAVRKDRVN